MARLSGDEFAILLESAVDRQDAIGVAERVQTLVGEPIEVAGREVMVTASVGICVERRSEVEQADVLLRAADVAMYRAKRKGKGRFEFFEPGMHLEAVERLDLRTDLQIALERGQFRLHYQPITRLRIARSSRSRPCCAGNTRPVASSCPIGSSRLPSRPGRSSRSVDGY